MCSIVEHVIELLHTLQTIDPGTTAFGDRRTGKTRHTSNTCLISSQNAATFDRMSDSDTPDAESDRPSRSAESTLTPRQRTILDVIRASVTSRGYPPSIREIGDAVGLTSTSSVAHQLRTLEKKGYLRRDPNRPRAVDVRRADDVLGA